MCHIKLSRNTQNPGPTSVARAVARAMADRDPPGETILQRSALLQVRNTTANPLFWSSKATELIRSPLPTGGAEQ